MTGINYDFMMFTLAHTHKFSWVVVTCESPVLLQDTTMLDDLIHPAFLTLRATLCKLQIMDIKRNVNESNE